MPSSQINRSHVELWPGQEYPFEQGSQSVASMVGRGEYASFHAVLHAVCSWHTIGRLEDVGVAPRAIPTLDRYVIFRVVFNIFRPVSTTQFFGFHSFSFACLSIHPFLYSISEVGVDRVRRWVGGLSCVDALCSGGHGILCSFIVDDGSFLHLQHRFVACFFILFFF